MRTSHLCVLIFLSTHHPFTLFLRVAMVHPHLFQWSTESFTTLFWAPPCSPPISSLHDYSVSTYPYGLNDWSKREHLTQSEPLGCNETFAGVAATVLAFRYFHSPLEFAIPMNTDWTSNCQFLGLCLRALSGCWSPLCSCMQQARVLGNGVPEEDQGEVSEVPRVQDVRSPSPQPMADRSCWYMPWFPVGCVFYQAAHSFPVGLARDVYRGKCLRKTHLLASFPSLAHFPSPYQCFLWSLPKKPLILKSLSQGLLLGEAKARHQDSSSWLWFKGSAALGAAASREGQTLQVWTWGREEPRDGEWCDFNEVLLEGSHRVRTSYETSLALCAPAFFSPPASRLSFSALSRNPMFQSCSPLS